MVIQGFQKTTLLDFPGKVAATVFTGGCNFRCPFCHNASLVTHINREEAISEDEVLSYLNKRKGILDGVCITGGEPLLQSDIAAFCRKIREIGLAIKLDTNGSRPEALRDLIDRELVDYVAMDIKNCKEKYALTCGLEHFPDGVEESIRLIMSCGLPYEFRTTVTEELHTVEDMVALSEWIRGAERYFIQCFTDSGDLIGENLSAPTPEKLNELLSAAQRAIPVAALRGI